MAGARRFYCTLERFMSSDCTVIVGAPELQAGLRQHAGADGDVLAFSDKEALKALDAIAARQPRMVVLERLFAATSRGAALINRIKADPGLSGAEIRVIAHDGTYSRVSPRRPAPAAPPTAAGTDSDAAVDTIAPAVPSLDYRGTRRAPRVRMAGGTTAQVDGVAADIIDLSTMGAQIVSPTPMKPAQPLRFVLTDEYGIIRLTGFVAWVSFEIPKGASRYRAGVEFRDADGKALEGFCNRHTA
jgi:hypothetical protein